VECAVDGCPTGLSEASDPQIFISLLLGAPICDDTGQAYECDLQFVQNMSLLGLRESGRKSLDAGRVTIRYRLTP
jgi:hypothetical protein